MIARVILGLIGAGIIVFTFFAGDMDLIGLEAGSMGLFVVGAFGALLVLLAVAGKRLPGHKIGRGYQQLAVILLNTLLFIIVLEMLVILSFNLQFVTRDVQRLTVGEGLEVYQDEDWFRTYQQEYDDGVDAVIKYSPFELWARDALTGETINIQADGSRATPGAVCTDDAYRVFVYGGSTLWGMGAPDWGTIPAHLQAAINEADIDGPVCVVNYGELAYVSMQEFIRLIRSLQRDDVPDLVIFYNGINDVVAAWNTDRSDGHRLMNIFNDAMRDPFAGRSPLADWLARSYTFQLLQALLPAPDDDADATGQTRAELAAEVARQYLNTYLMVDALAEVYGFDYALVLQPVMALGDKPLVGDEVGMLQVIDQPLRSFYAQVYDAIVQQGADYPHLHDIRDVFDDVDQPVYIDYQHLAPPGNEIVAGRIFEIIQPLLVNGAASP